MEPNNQNVCNDCCKCNHHHVEPIAIILIGVTVLLQTFDVINAHTSGIIWPILLIVAASGKFCKCCR